MGRDNVPMQDVAVSTQDINPASASEVLIDDSADKSLLYQEDFTPRFSHGDPSPHGSPREPPRTVSAMELEDLRNLAELPNERMLLRAAMKFGKEKERASPGMMASKGASGRVMTSRGLSPRMSPRMSPRANIYS